MNTSIEARQIHWHLHVNALTEMKALLDTDTSAVDPELLDQCRYQLFTGIQAVQNLIVQEDWKPEMPAYPTTKLKLDHLQEYWGRRHKLSPDDPTFIYDSLDKLLFATAAVEYLTKQVQLYIRFAGE